MESPTAIPTDIGALPPPAVVLDPTPPAIPLAAPKVEKLSETRPLPGADLSDLWVERAAGLAPAVAPPVGVGGTSSPASGSPGSPHGGGGPVPEPEPPPSPQGPGGPSMGSASSSAGFFAGTVFAAFLALMGLAALRSSRLIEAAACLRPQAHLALLERPG